VRRHLTPDDVIASMRMLRRTFTGTWILVEGDTDRAVLERFVDPDSGMVQPCQGKRGVLVVMSQRHKARLGGAVAVVDTDFWWLDHRSPPSDVVVTDAHDLEAMLIASRALDAVLAEHADPDRLQAFLDRAGPFPSLRDLLYDRCRPSATLRLINSREDLGLRFAKLPVSGYVEPTALRFDAMRYLRDVHARSRTTASLDQVGRMLVAELRKDYDPALLCQGHDMVELLAYALRECGFAKRPPSAYHPKLIEKDLRLAYDSRYFRRTELYEHLREWSAARGEDLLDV